MSDLLTHRSPWRARFASKRAWLILGLVLLLVAVVRVRLLDTPLERDEGEYAYAGQLLLQGVPPYTLAYNMKLPGTYFAYALSMAVFGQSPAGIHFGLLLINLASISLVFLIGCRLLDEVGGVVAAASFALLSLSPSVLGQAAHATHYVTFCALIGAWLLLQVTDRFRTAMPETPTRCPSTLATLHVPVFLSGLFFGLAFLMKQHGVFFGIFGLLYLAWTCLSVILAEEATPKKGLRLARTPASRPAVSSGPGASPGSVLTAPRRLNAIQAKKLAAQNASALQEAGTPSRGPLPVQARATEGGVSDSPRASDFGPPSAPRPSDLELPSVARNSDLGVPSDPRSSDSGLRPGLPQPPPKAWLLTTVLLFVAGLALPYALTGLVLAIAGAGHQFWFWTFSYAAKYVSAIPLVKGADVLKGGLHAVIGPNLIFWLLPWAGALLMWWEERLETAHRVFLMLLFFCSVGSVSLGLYFREHYFITLLPVMALLIGVGVSRSLHIIQRDRSIELFVAAPVLILFVIALGATLIGSGAFWFSMSPDRVVRNTYGTTLFSQARQVAAQLKANTPPGRTVAVLGSEPEIYFYAHRRSATGYIYVYPLMETHPYARTMQEQMIAEIERAKPEYVVYVEDTDSWLRTPDSDGRLEQWWQGYVLNELELVNVAQIQEGQDREEFLERKAGESSGPRAAKHLLVYKRRAALN